jgi:hypothetical protein
MRKMKEKDIEQGNRRIKQKGKREEGKITLKTVKGEN